MTPEQAKELLPIMEAFANGKTIQAKNREVSLTGWIDIVQFHSSVNCEYRIKPEPPKPREWWVCETGAGFISGLCDRADAMNYVHKFGGKTVHVREVLE